MTIKQLVANVEERAEEMSNNVEDSLDYSDEQSEELLKNVTQETTDSDRNMEAEQKIKRLAESRHKKMQELEKRIIELTRKCMVQDKIIKAKEKQDEKIKVLFREKQLLKEARIKLIRQKRNDANNFTKWKKSKEIEMNKMRKQDRKRAYEMVRMKIEHNKQENVFKKKMEVAFAVNKRLQRILEMQKKSMQREKRKANSKEEIKTWVAQKLKVLMTTVETNYSLEKLMQNKASLVHQLEQLKKNKEWNERELVTITEFIELRKAQIADLQQKILESNQETGTNTRWNIIRTTLDAAVALETAFHIVTQDKKQQYYKYIELKEKYQNLEVRLENMKISCPQ